MLYIDQVMTIHTFNPYINKLIFAIHVTCHMSQPIHSSSIWHVTYQSSQESESIKFPQVKIHFATHSLGFTCHMSHNM